MHESRLVAALVAKAEAFAAEAGSPPARIGIRIGALSGVEESVLRGYWERFAGPMIAEAVLDIVVDDDPGSAGALGVDLLYLEVVGKAG
jgi:Zn finger protein HypA/HybF involved in hydrogenase expression